MTTTTASADDVTPSGRSLCDGLTGIYSVAFHVAAVVVILAVSMLGAALPMLTQYIAVLRTNPYAFAVGKTAATGVLLSVSCIHLINEASVAFREACVPAAFKNYEAYAFLFALSAALLMQALDLQLAIVAERWLRARHARECTRAGGAGDNDNDNNNNDADKAITSAAVTRAVDKGSVVIVAVDATTTTSNHSSSDNNDNNNDNDNNKRSHCRNDSHGRRSSSDHGAATAAPPTRCGSEDVRAAHDDDDDAAPHDDRTAAPTRAHDGDEAASSHAHASAPPPPLRSEADATHDGDAHDGVAATTPRRRTATTTTTTAHDSSHDHHNDDDRATRHAHDDATAAACGVGGHTHGGAVLPPEEMSTVRRVIAAVCMECGVTLHSVFVGLAVGLTTDAELKPLLVALVFHQLFEGMAMGSRLVDAQFHRCLEWTLAGVFAVSAPAGMVVGIVAAVVSPHTMSGGGFVSMLAVLDAFCGGILLYLAFSLLLFDFVADVRLYSADGLPRRRRKKCGLYAALWTGMLLMAAVGKWL